MTTATYRVEHDSMGALEVPTTALWGAQAQRAIQNFPPSGLKMPRAFIRALGLIAFNLIQSLELLGIGCRNVADHAIGGTPR